MQHFGVAPVTQMADACASGPVNVIARLSAADLFDTNVSGTMLLDECAGNAKRVTGNGE